jgi:signal transduction histidine kinase/ligand-binding sensor domain-containing protein
VFDIEEQRNGKYWVGTHRGLAEFDPVATPRFNRRAVAGDPTASVRKILLTKAGVLWIGTSAGLYKQAGNEFQRVELSSGRGRPLLVTSLIEDRSGILWIGTRAGLFRLNTAAAVERQYGLPDERVEALMQDRAGRIWIATRGGLCFVAAGGLQRVGALLTGIAVRSVIQRADGSVWAATDHGLLQAFPHVVWVTTAEGLSDSSATALEEDEAENLWAGTGIGVERIARSGFYTYGVKDGLAASDVVSVFAGKDGRVVVETLVGRPVLHVFEDDRFTAISLRLPRLRNAGSGVGQMGLQDPTGDWWIATGEGLFRQGPSGVRQFTRDEIETVFQDSHGDVWFHGVDVATVYRWERASGKLKMLSPSESGVPPNADVGPLIEDHAGNLWMGLGGSPVKLVRYRAGRSVQFARRHGIPNGPIIALHVDDGGVLWAGSMDNGLIRVNDPASEHPQFLTFGLAEGLGASHISCITSDRWRRIYACTTLGVDRLDPLSGKIEHFGVQDGLPGERLQHAFRDRNGSLWFATAQGLARLDPQPPSRRRAPTALISAVKIRGVSENVSDLGASAITLPDLDTYRNQFQLEFASLNFVPAERIRYQYRISGVDHDWSAPAASRTVNYASLNPGHYRFEVRAVTMDGETSPVPAYVDFTILPPWWRRLWVEAAAGLALGAAVYVAHRYRVRYLLAVERVRIRIASDLHDDVGSSLTQIAILSEVARRNSPDGQLDKIANVSREALRSISDIIWAVDPERDSLGDLITRMRQFANDLFGSGGIELRFDAGVVARDVEIGADGRRQLFLIFKEALHNIAKHSLSTRAHVEVAMDNDTIILRVSDNGRGFDFATVAQGNGLRSMSQRAQDLGGTLSVHSSAGGSELTLRVPVTRRWKRRYTKV